MPLDRRAFLAAASSAAAAWPGEGRAGQGMTEALSDLVRRVRIRRGLRAVLFGAWSGKRALLVQALGRSAGGEAARTDMHFRAAAVTTTYVNALLLHLAERGRVRLDDPVGRWFPDLPRGEEVTLRMLGENSSGYGDYLASAPFQTLRPSIILRPWTATELIRLGTGLPIAFPPGTGFHYSHTNAVLLGEALQKATGKPIHRLLRHAFLEPFGLRQTEYPLTRAIRAPRLHAWSAEFFGARKDTTWWNPAWVSHSGLMNTDLKDLGRWARLLGSGAVLSKDSYKALVAQGNVGRGGNSPDLYYGMGVIVANGWIMQNGLYFGWNPVMAHLPSRDITIALTTTLGDQALPDISHGLHLIKEAARLLVPDQPIPERYV